MVQDRNKMAETFFLHLLMRKILYMLVVAAFVASCSTPENIAYFQDAHQNQSLKLQAERQFRLRPEDKINIVVNSKDPVLETLFTLTAPSARNSLGVSSMPKTVAGKGSSSGYGQTIAYTVDKNGEIDFPVLGKIKVEGMTRQEVALEIKKRLIAANLVNDPVVTVEYVNIAISVLGDVAKPGRIDINQDHFTILDAIAYAGDLTINGERESVMVLRKEGGEQKTYFVNLCSGQDLVNSPVYYLQQNDVVYVTPNDRRKRESTVSGNTVLTPSFWISVASLLTTITALIIR